MLARTLIATAALVGLMMTGAVTTTAFAQASGSQTMAPEKKPMKKEMHKGSGKMAKEGHKMDNIADKLNACETMPADQRQGCVDNATKM